MSKFARRLELALQMNNMRAVELSKKTGISSATLRSRPRWTFTPTSATKKS